MTADRDAADGDDPDPLLAVVADPERGPDRLPYLLGSLDAADRTRRLRAALAICLVAESSPDLLEPIVRRLVDRLDGDPPVEVPHALDYLAARDPRAVDEVVTDLADEAELRARQYLYQSGAGFARNEYLRASPGDRGVGRTRLAGGDTGSDPRQVYTDRSTGDAPDRRADEQTGGQGAEEGVNAEDADEGSDETGEGDADDSDDETDERGDDADERGDGQDLTRGALSLVEKRLSAVIDRSRFDDLTVLTERRRERFGDRYRAVGTVDDAETALAVTVFRVPDGDGTAFARSLRNAIGSWAGVDDHDSVLTVHDWALRPRPWAALEYTESSLAERDALAPDEAVANAVDVAEAVAHAHQHGVVHGALDPETVRYPGATLTASRQQRPRVTAFGLARVYADYLGLADVLDPRFAAPEHFDGRFGRVDHATDVYALGALLYRLATGEAPFLGRPEEVRTGVLSDRTPVPSEAAPGLPAGLDRVVRKAMATRKLTRYETVTHFRRELEGIDTDGG
ncbi:protein kinase domain-containing protein [Halosimplex amylolyticum]|uniref:protein kinase domain-containing protein n=1 Tax=Halosimplex amylolyticum TaxID=3396616 RepID=UPI003F56AC4E